MSRGLKLTVYFGERDRTGRQFLADRLLDIFERHRLEVSLLVRGVEGFGVKHHLRTDRLLTLSEDLPVVAIAVDRSERIMAALASVEELRFDGLVTLERARLLDHGEIEDGVSDGLGEAAKLTLYFGRGIRVGGRPGYEAAVELLHQAGMSGATVLLGVDGTIGGGRQRARFFSGNAEVPVMVVSVGVAAHLQPLIRGLVEALGRPVITVERLRVLKRDGEKPERFEPVADFDENGLNRWQKLMLYSSERASFGGRPVHVEAVRRLRREGAAGATALRGIWGYDGRYRPHGDTFWRVRRRVPTLTVTVDAPSRIERWLKILDAITPERGLITAEIVPAFRATGELASHGGLQLADQRFDESP